jgi:hypothetical protein
MIKIKVFNAASEPEKCIQFLNGHKKVLEEFQLENVTSNTPEWVAHKGTIVLIAERHNEIIAGARVQLYDPHFALPLEDAVAHFDPKILDLVIEKNKDGGTAEICGLWNARVLPPNLGITRIVCMAAVSLAKQINVKNMFCICAGYTLPMARKMGMQIQTQVGENGEFVYPNSNFRARVLCMDAYSLNTATQEMQIEIGKLIHNRNYATEILVGDQLESLIFDLNIPTLVTNG